MALTTDNPQIALWRGKFGDDYLLRNTVNDVQVEKLRLLWTEILAHTAPTPLHSILEIGPSTAFNLRALRSLTDACFYAVEPNDRARSLLVQDGVIDAADLRAGVAADIAFPDGFADLVFTSGVLIHIHPNDLLASCKEMHRCTKKWIVCIEYFADEPETKSYRGHDNLLFKRDFGSFWLDHFPDLHPVAYGFSWKRMTGLGNTTWWLFRKL